VTFVDTSAWYALFVSSDANHLAATRWASANPGPLMTTDYVLDETLTLMRSKGQRTVAIEFGEYAFKGLAGLCFITRNDVDAAWTVFRDFDDKDWSFTDCTSKVVIEQFGIQTAITFDHHFRQFGTVTVVP
jgi:predicted nucleic acid-binding protein